MRKYTSMVKAHNEVMRLQDYFLGTYQSSISITIRLLKLGVL